MKEEWKKIEEWDYEVSNLGRCRSLDRTVIQACNADGLLVTRLYKGRILKEDKTTHLNKTTGESVIYHRVTMSNKKKRRRESVHRLVAIAFIERESGKDYINHKDENPSNNAASNLEWCTRSENELHKYKNGFRQIQSKFTPDEVIELRGSEKGCMEIAKEYNVSPSTASDMLNKKTYKRIV